MNIFVLFQLCFDIYCVFLLFHLFYIISSFFQECKRKATEDATEGPQQLIFGETGKMESSTLVPEDISMVRQAVYRVRRKTHPKLPKSRSETHFYYQ